MRLLAIVALVVATSALVGLLFVGVFGFSYMVDGWDLAWPREDTTETDATAGGALLVGGAVLVGATLLGLLGAAVAALFYLRTRT